MLTDGRGALDDQCYVTLAASEALAARHETSGNTGTSATGPGLRAGHRFALACARASERRSLRRASLIALPHPSSCTMIRLRWTSSRANGAPLHDRTRRQHRDVNRLEQGDREGKPLQGPYLEYMPALTQQSPYAPRSRDAIGCDAIGLPGGRNDEAPRPAAIRSRSCRCGHSPGFPGISGRGAPQKSCPLASPTLRQYQRT